MKLDLNCDLAEREPWSVMQKLMQLVTSANIATGGYGGEFIKVYACLKLAQEYGVRVGVHPGPLSRRGTGRGKVWLQPGELRALLREQVGVFHQIAKAVRVRVHHIKLHGALYHATEADPRVAREYLTTIRSEWPRAIVYAKAGGTVEQLAERLDVRVWPEAFVDRGYREDGSLVPRGRKGALLERPKEISQRTEDLLKGCVRTVKGTVLPMQPKTVCLHADTPGALRSARLARESLDCAK